MLPGNELMIGNKFSGIAGIQTVKSIIDHRDRYDAHEDTPHPAKFGYEYLILVEENGNQYKPIEIQPVVLTSKIFKIYEFESLSDGYWCKGDALVRETLPSRHKHTDWPEFVLVSNNKFSEKFSFLHELQNIYYWNFGKRQLLGN